MTGKYTFQFQKDGAEASRTFLLRNYYDGTWHGTLLDEQGRSVIVSNLTAENGTVAFTAKEPDLLLEAALQISGSSISGTVAYGAPKADMTKAEVSGTVREITPADDRAEKIQMKKKALIIYASITGNTEKIAKAFQRSFEHYGFTVDLCKITNRSQRPHFNYQDYDVVCMGSLIIAGSPTAAMIKQFSLGGGSDLESTVTKNAEAGLDFNAGGGALKGPGMDGPGGPGGPGPEMGPGGGGMALSYAGGPAPHGIYQPLGIVFTTYGGGFYGSNEAMATLETLKLYLELSSVKVVGTFACCGKEFGPAGLADGVKPQIMGGGDIDDPVYYKDADGNYHAGSYFFHTHMNSKPNARDIMKAEALVADLVEDYFYSHDGIRKDVASRYISIS